MEEVLVPEVFDRLQQAMAADLQGLADLYRDYLTDARRTVAGLHRALLQKDREQLRACAHYLKGSSQILGTQGVAQRCAALEEVARGNTLGGVEWLVKETESALDAAQRELARRLGTSVIPPERANGID